MRHFPSPVRALACAALLGALAPLPARAAAAPPDSTRYYVEEDGRGTGWFAVGRSTNPQGQLVYRGSGEKPGSYKVRRFEVVTGPDFVPVSSFVKMSAQGQPMEFTSTFAKGKAATQAKISGQKMPFPEERLEGVAFVLPGQVAGAFAALSDWLAKRDAATWKGSVKAYMAPFVVDIDVAGLGRRTVESGGGTAEVRAFQLTVKVPPSRQLPRGRTQELVLWQNPDGSFFGFEVAAQKLRAYPFPSDATLAEAPRVYPEIAVRFPSGADTLAGTLMLPLADPARPTKPPAIVFVSGSGPSTRNEDVAGFPVFRVLAEKLAAAGCASLRYDDRGVEDSGGDYGLVTMDILAADAAAATAALRARPEIDAARVGLLGHSEGALLAGQIAALVEQQSGQAPWCAILMAGSTANGHQIIMEQFEHALARQELPVEEAVAKRALQEQVLTYVEGRAGWETVTALADSGEAQDLAMEKATLDAPWLRSFLAYDPRPWLAKLRVPTLVLHGELDTQLPPAHGAAVRDLLKASGNTTVSFVPARGVNHLFQLAKTGEAEEYATLKPEFAPGVAERITAFVAMRERMK
ncbi:MAG: alpha/beta fold hydrolase [Candidatus Krumholzibacteriia bacterium]